MQPRAGQVLCPDAKNRGLGALDFPVLVRITATARPWYSRRRAGALPGPRAGDAEETRDARHEAGSGPLDHLLLGFEVVDGHVVAGPGRQRRAVVVLVVLEILRHARVLSTTTEEVQTINSQSVHVRPGYAEREDHDDGK